MIGHAFHAIIYLPIYNALVFFVDHIPTHDIGIAVIIVTFIVRIILWPLSKRAVKAQMDMKRVAPEIEEIKKKYKDKPEEQSKAILALYRERDIHPFAGFLLLLVQLPILLGLYWVFARGGFPVVHTEYLYTFVAAPPVVNMEFLGLINMAGHSVVLALIAMLAQLTYTRLSMGPRGSQTPIEAVEQSFSSEMAKSFDLQARYVLPLIVGFIGYTVAAAAPLYWATSNLFMIGQEYLAGRRFNPEK
ncbi:MAG: membrane protein insertase YidC [Candidatus Kaiserbacteria bacterium]|nr:membrane protein insertase YidC [Candidatus Kaiserbacteria bacterium]